MPAPKKKLFLSKRLFILLAILLIGFLLPASFSIPVQGPG